MPLYEHAIVKGEIRDDPMQRTVITHLQRVADELTSARHWWNWGRRYTPVRGLYLCGPVGVGKTFLMDLLYDNVTSVPKARFHFHHFMQQIDAQLRCLQGKKNPLQCIAKDLARTTRLLCLDEFLVHDVADAMLLGDLLQALLTHDVVLVATSNTTPDALYLNGVQRARFLPAIDLIKAQCETLVLAEHPDYRVGRVPLLHAYVYPLNAMNEAILEQQFQTVAGPLSEGNALNVQQRMIPCIKWAARAVWFSFDVICNLPRSQLDYLELAERFDTVVVSGIPQLTNNQTVHAILLIHFVDVMYDRGVRLILSAAVPLDDLYKEGEMSTAFKRTKSRLEEMQSVDYLNRRILTKRHAVSSFGVEP